MTTQKKKRTYEWIKSSVHSSHKKKKSSNQRRIWHDWAIVDDNGNEIVNYDNDTNIK